MTHPGEVQLNEHVLAGAVLRTTSRHVVGGGRSQDAPQFLDVVAAPFAGLQVRVELRWRGVVRAPEHVLDQLLLGRVCHD